MPHQNLSTATLFHFTRSLDNLLGIFREGLRPAYSLEDFSHLGGQLPTETSQIALPMSCFCDIPLSQTRPHMERYGKYAIGMSKAWGTTVGIAPVLYTLGGTGAAAALWNVMLSIGAGAPRTPLSANLERLLCFVKPYAGVLAASGHEVRFYDEREWRFVPLEGDGSVRPMSTEQLRAAREANPTAPAFHGFRLLLPVAHLRYILVQDDAEILPVMDVIQQLGGSFTVNESRLLQSRIISSAQVAEDF